MRHPEPRRPSTAGGISFYFAFSQREIPRSALRTAALGMTPWDRYVGTCPPLTLSIVSAETSNDFAKKAEKDLEFSYGESDSGLWHEAATVRGRGRGGPGSGEAHERPRSARHHAHARRQ